MRRRGRAFSRLRASLFLFVAVASATASVPASAQTVHRLEAGPSTVAFGHYDPAKPGVLRITSGDIVEVTTMLTSNPTRLQKMGLSAGEVQPELVAIYEQVTDRGPGGHILTGPIHVEGAEPGDVLEVRILEVGYSVDYGYNGCSGFVRDLCDPDNRSRLIRIDRIRNRAGIAPGIEVPLRPFFGSMGVAPPPDSGRVSSNPPGQHAGNMDNKEVGAGTTLYIPVWVPGALFEVGDGHAVQGDGEVDQTGLETSLEGRPLEKATEIAIREATEFIMLRTGLTSGEAYSVISMAADLRITQLVDGNKGVHVMVPKDLITR